MTYISSFQHPITKQLQYPMASTVVSLSDLNGLLDILVAIAGKWELFLIPLGVSEGDIDQIKTERAQLPDSSKLCLLDGLKRWVKCSDRPTYGSIIHALNSNLLTDKPLAALVEELAQQKTKCGDTAALAPMEPVHSVLPEPILCQTKSENTSYELTSVPRQTSTTPVELTSETSPPETSPPAPTKVTGIYFNKAQALSKRKALQQWFTSLVVQLKGYLKTMYTDGMLPEFLYGFIMELPYTVKEEHEKFFDRKNSEICKAGTFDELFLCLSTYWDFLNYTLLEGIIECHGTEEMEQEMEFYVGDLGDFRRKTTLHVFWQLERHKIRTKPPPGFSQFVTKHSITRESTLEDVENIRLEITDEFHLCKCALLLVHVVEGSVVITWFVPTSAIHHLKHGLGQSDVLARLRIDSVEFSDEEGNPIDLPQDWKYNPEIFDVRLYGSLEDDGSVQGILFEAAKIGDTARVIELLDFGTKINATDKNGKTALMKAAKHGHKETVEALAALGADVNIQDDTGSTALKKAAKCGHKETIEALAALAIDFNIRDEEGATALLYAALFGHTKTVQALVTLGADMYIQSEAGITALMCAASEGHTDTVKGLEALGADIQVQDDNGKTALMHTFEGDEVRLETAVALVAAGTKLDLQEKSTGWTALFFAAKNGSLPLVKLMLERGADPTIRDKEGSTGYDVASAYDHEDVMEELAKYTPPPHAEASPPPAESTTSSSTAQPTETAQSISKSQSSKRERVFRAARILAERIEKMALPGRARKREIGGPLPGPEEELIIDPSQRQKSNKPGERL